MQLDRERQDRGKSCLGWMYSLSIPSFSLSLSFLFNVPFILLSLASFSSSYHIPFSIMKYIGVNSPFDFLCSLSLPVFLPVFLSLLHPPYSMSMFLTCYADRPTNFLPAQIDRWTQKRQNQTFSLSLPSQIPTLAETVIDRCSVIGSVSASSGFVVEPQLLASRGKIMRMREREVERGERESERERERKKEVL